MLMLGFMALYVFVLLPLPAIVAVCRTVCACSAPSERLSSDLIRPSDDCF